MQCFHGLLLHHGGRSARLAGRSHGRAAAPPAANSDMPATYRGSNHIGGFSHSSLLIFPLFRSPSFSSSSFGMDRVLLGFYLALRGCYRDHDVPLGDSIYWRLFYSAKLGFTWCHHPKTTTFCFHSSTLSLWVPIRRQISEM